MIQPQKPCIKACTRPHDASAYLLPRLRLDVQGHVDGRLLTFHGGSGGLSLRDSAPLQSRAHSLGVSPLLRLGAANARTANTKKISSWVTGLGGVEKGGAKHLTMPHTPGVVDITHPPPPVRAACAWDACVECGGVRRNVLSVRQNTCCELQVKLSVVAIVSFVGHLSPSRPQGKAVIAIILLLRVSLCSCMTGRRAGRWYVYIPPPPLPDTD